MEAHKEFYHWQVENVESLHPRYLEITVAYRRGRKESFVKMFMTNVLQGLKLENYFTVL
jgi:hypothetical protein